MKKLIIFIFIFAFNQIIFAQKNQYADFIKTWNFIKYYHPDVASGKVDADSLFLSTVKNINSKDDFNSVINTTSIIGACIFACMLIGIGHFLVFKWKGNKLIGWYNILVLIFSFASIIGVLSFRLPLNVEFPEMFTGLAIPMHFFPALAYFALEPFFCKT